MNYPTLSGLSSESIVPVAGGRKSSESGKTAVLISSDLDFKNIRSNSLKPESANFYFSTLFTDKDKIAYAGPYIGAPYGVVLLESLVAKGYSKILILGWCGSISNDLKAGDMIIPDAAISDEGTSRNYTDIDEHFPELQPSVLLSGMLGKKLDQKGIGYVNRKIWTTDAIFRETPEKVEFFREKGACAVEMECSALFAAARFRKVDIASLLVVSDEIKCGESVKEWVPGFNKHEFKQARREACRLIVESAQDLNRQKD